MNTEGDPVETYGDYPSWPTPPRQTTLSYTLTRTRTPLAEHFPLSRKQVPIRTVLGSDNVIVKASETLQWPIPKLRNILGKLVSERVGGRSVRVLV